MPATKWQRRRTYVRAHLPWRLLFKNKTVHRNVQGVELSMPWAHLLPDYARSRSTYGQNLIALAVQLERRSVAEKRPIRVLDIGANIGDSAAQIMAQTDALVLCVEGDPYWARYLRMNLGDNSRAVIEESLLTPAEGEWESATPIRTQGTTRFSNDASTAGHLPSLSTMALRDAHPEFAQLRLIKSDTDGLDPVLVPAAAAAWKDSSPVLFFEFDPTMARGCDNSNPNLIWKQLAELGYSRLAIWDNGGDPLGQLSIDDAASAASILEPTPSHLGYDFWDVAACTDDDAAAIAAFEELVPQSYSELGTWR